MIDRAFGVGAARLSFNFVIVLLLVGALVFFYLVCVVEIGDGECDADFFVVVRAG